MLKSLKDAKPGGKLPFFQYTRLDPSTKEIRLVRILPGEPEEAIRIEIFHSPLLPPEPGPEPRRWTVEALQESVPRGWRVHESVDGRILFRNTDVDGRRYGATSWTHPDPAFDREAYADAAPLRFRSAQPRYEALSYVWGGRSSFGSGSVVVECAPDGPRKLRIGGELGDALRNLRDIEAPRVMWIDALCINQKDFGERSEQVPRMGQIYTWAHRVVAWTGPRSPDSQLAIDTLTHLGRQIIYTKDRYILPLPGGSPADDDILDPLKPLPGASAEVWTALHSLFRRKWFHRLWILQEIQLANTRSILKCGPSEILWPLFRRAMALIDVKPLGRPPDVSSSMTYAVATSADSTTMSFEALLGASAHREYTNPLDRIYGLLSLASPRLVRSIEVNYALSPIELFRGVFWAHLELTRRLGFLRFREIGFGVSRGFAAPSWVPDFTLDRYDIFPGVDDPFCASSMSAAHVRSLAPDEIEVAGFAVATVRALETLEIRSLGDVAAFVRRRGLERLLASPYRAGGPELDAYLQVLACYHLRPRFDFPAQPTLQEWRDEVVALARGGGHATQHGLPAFEARMVANVEGKAFFDTEEGYVGTCHLNTLPGDRVVVLLGCDVPVVLRPTVTGGAYEVMGCCFLHGVMDGEAILGPVEPPWEIRSAVFGQDTVLGFHNRDSGEETWRDPRLEAIPLPGGWEPVDWERTHDDPGNCCRFKNTDTGEVINSDPRLLPEPPLRRRLAQRNMTLERMRLVSSDGKLDRHGTLPSILTSAKGSLVFPVKPIHP